MGPIAIYVCISIKFVLKSPVSASDVNPNKRVANLLNKLLIELTKFHTRHGNDNALVESKNGSIVRKHLGYMHIP
uniref:Uncharacterized protein n=1 Tax=Candidatus Kentrum sp. LFY TaxID=2126342 RepID=A0A450V751_9GAMM|nr:MAG: hypothetical protein BECKLFY1418B_GA0070995_12001 [Candidatus Kentron sp. LFY]VFK02315.1 MAG: hypothetical protein BECKLFY1418A_GA0070994_11892 [Candidatus Kentron sp. LFY]